MANHVGVYYDDFYCYDVFYVSVYYDGGFYYGVIWVIYFLFSAPEINSKFANYLQFN